MKIFDRRKFTYSALKYKRIRVVYSKHIIDMLLNTYRR